ncbi:MOSC domain-containing protein [Thalassotalea aquiviva]|uniref:MOSC domain-containing protein n=1 Tax=Thalassotalea aquiviva TaxID=3242415 RepID=UPI00352B78A2
MITLTDIMIYPIKSTAGIALNKAHIGDTGLPLDRHFVITDLNGKFITGRTKAQLVHVKTKMQGQALSVRAPGMPDLELNPLNFANEYQQVQVWQDKIDGQTCNKEADDWFSQYLNTPCRLFYYGHKSARQVVNSEHQLSFADGFPLLGISKASLDDLNQKLAEPVTMAQFRPNLIFSGTLPFAEDGWLQIAIGECQFLVAKPCSRCIFTTVDALTGERNPLREPLTTLMKYRQAEDGQIYFGQNMIPLTKGELNVGDEVRILSNQKPLKLNG